MTGPSDERSWLLAAGAGDRDAFDALVTHTAPVVWRVVRRLAVDDAAAEDALQETFLAAWRGASAYRGDTSARGWLFGVARRQAARTWRRRAGEPLCPEDLKGLAVTAGWGSNPEHLASRAEDRAELLAALGSLSETDREVLGRCDLEGESSEVVGESLGIAPGTVRVRLHRARLRLMTALRAGGVHE